MTDSLLVATYQKLIYYDGKQCNVILNNPDNIYSITWNQENIFVITGKHILVYDDIWQLQETISFWDTGLDPHPHQAIWHNGLFIVLSGYNYIAHYVGAYTSIIEWLGKYCKSNDDPHINSIWYSNHRFFVVEHWRDKLPKKIRIFDEMWKWQCAIDVTKELFDDRWNGIHNVYVENEKMYTLGPRRIITLGKQQDTVKTDFDIPWQFYFRGLARTDNHFYVGVSKHNKLRENRASGESAILVLDDNLNQENLIILNDTGQVHDVRAMVDDKAHNGIDCPFKG